MRNWTRYMQQMVDGGDAAAAPGVEDEPEGAPAGEPEGAPAGEPSGEPGGEPQAAWPEDWRQKIAPDEKHLKTLERFDSPKALYESYMALRQRMDSGELKPGEFPANGTPEEQAAWRQAHGVPEKAEDYYAALDEGLAIGEDDKPLVDDFLKKAHEQNMPAEQVAQTVNWFLEQQEAAIERQQAQDQEFLQQAEDTLRTEWGADYRRNINLIKGLVDTMPVELQAKFVGARAPDGNALLNDPDFARWLVNTSRQVNPVATVVPGAGANAAAAIEDEIASIEKVMRENREAYNRDEKMQARLRELYAARERAKA